MHGAIGALSLGAIGFRGCMEWLPFGLGWPACTASLRVGVARRVTSAEDGRGKPVHHRVKERSTIGAGQASGNVRHGRLAKDRLRMLVTAQAHCAHQHRRTEQAPTASPCRVSKPSSGHGQISRDRAELSHHVSSANALPRCYRTIPGRRSRPLRGWSRLPCDPDAATGRKCAATHFSGDSHQPVPVAGTVMGLYYLVSVVGLPGSIPPGVWMPSGM